MSLIESSANDALPHKCTKYVGSNMHKYIEQSHFNPCTLRNVKATQMYLDEHGELTSTSTSTQTHNQHAIGKPRSLGTSLGILGNGMVLLLE